jgi:hypothetical protein
MNVFACRIEIWHNNEEKEKNAKHETSHREPAALVDVVCLGPRIRKINAIPWNRALRAEMNVSWRWETAER